MDATRFDRLARVLASQATRRGTGRLLSIVPLAAIAALLDETSAAARRQRRQRRQHREPLHEQGKNKKKKQCAKSGQATSKKRKQCCKGLVKDGAGRCAAPCVQSCPGCCNGDICETGTSAAACGSGGVPCGVCSGLQGTCFNGSCHCDVCASGCPFTTVQAAIDAASPGATIALCAGTFTGTIEIDKTLTLIGAGDGAGPGNTIVDGADAGTVVTIAGESTAILQNLRLTGGNAAFGAGIRNFGTLALIDCTVIGNAATNFGGGIRNDGTLTLTGSAVTANTSDNFGGGIDNRGPLTLTDSAVSGNTASNGGGGILNSEATLELISSLVSANTAGTFGGGISNPSGGVVTLEASSVSGNHAGTAGGGIFNSGAVSCSGGSAVSGNTADAPPVPSNCFDAPGGTGCATCPA